MVLGLRIAPSAERDEERLCSVEGTLEKLLPLAKRGALCSASDFTSAGGICKEFSAKTGPVLSFPHLEGKSGLCCSFSEGVDGTSGRG